MRQKRLRWFVPALATLAACGGGDAPQVGPPDIPVVEVTSRDVPVYLEAVGETLGALDIAIRARVEGTLDAKHFREGFPVEKGQLLYEIDPLPFEATVREARGQLAEANARFVRAQSDLRRIRPLVEIDALSQRTLDDAIAEHDASEGMVEAMAAIVENAEIQLSYTKIKSSIDGLIGISEAYPGDFVGRHPNPVVLTTVSSLDPIRVRFSISEREYLDLVRRRGGDWRQNEDAKRESRLELFLSDGSLYDHVGQVRFAGREIDARTGTLLIEAEFPNPDRALRPGQFARVRGQVELKKDASLVPQAAVHEIQGVFQLFVVGSDGSVQVRRVKPAERIGQLWVIDDGVAAGEMVAVGGFHLMRPGTKVVPVPAKNDPTEKSGQ